MQSFVCYYFWGINFILTIFHNDDIMTKVCINWHIQKIFGGEQMKKLLISIITMLMVGMLTACGNVKIDLNDYITFEAEGYDSLGTVTYKFDKDKFEEDYGDKIEIKKSNEEIQFESAFGMEPIEIMYDLCIRHSIDKDTNLSNGDVVKVQWECKTEEASEYFGCTLNFKDLEYKVTGLKEVDTFDPFEYLTVTFEGVSPKAYPKLEIDYTAPQMQYITFYANNNNLKIGDSAKIQAKISNGLSVDEFAEKFGMIPGVMEKTYEVKDVPYYLTDLSEIPEEDMEMLKNVFIDWYKDYVNKKWADPSTLGEIEYLGNYFLISKPDSYSTGNYLYLTFKINAKHPENGKDVDTYLYVYYTNIIKNPEGFEYGEATVPNTGWFMSESVTVDGYTYVGFASSDDLYKSHIETKVSQYEFTTDVKK